MTLGEKISQLRNSVNISQEELSERLGVTRQSISKWERNVVVPKMDIIMKMCRIFDVSTDELIKDENSLDRLSTQAKPLRHNSRTKYFGADGFIGEANVELTSDHAYKIGRFIGWYYHSNLVGNEEYQSRPKIVIGKDTRRSSYTLQYALASGLLASGADVYILHVTTAPSISYITHEDGFACGITISAGHNPYYDNGINIVDSHGKKIGLDMALMIEAYIDGEIEKLGITDDVDIPFATKDKMGCIYDYTAGKNRYTGYLISLASHSFRKLKIGLDCANGSSWLIAKNVFNALGAETFIIGNNPNGTNINQSCGTLHTEALKNLVLEENLDMGFAFDGDAERCIAIDENGNELDGDKIIYLLARNFSEREVLENRTVVVTEESNHGLDEALEALKIKTLRVKPSTKSIYSALIDNGSSIGGDKYGLVCLTKFATIGDGLLTAIMVTEAVLQRKMPLSDCVSDVKFYPKRVKSFSVNRHYKIDETYLKAKENEYIEKLGDQGHCSIIYSEKDNIIQVTVEAATDSVCHKTIDEIKRLLESANFIIF